MCPQIRNKRQENDPESIKAPDYVNSHGYCSVEDSEPQHKKSGMNNDQIVRNTTSIGGLIKDDDKYRESILKSHSIYYQLDAINGKPIFCGEVGACQRRPGIGDYPDKNGYPRNKAHDLPKNLTTEKAKIQEDILSVEDDTVEWRFQKAVSTFHYTVWASLLCKASAAPLAWCDGKEFGEMEWRDGNKDRFGKSNYEVNYYEELRILGSVIKSLNLEAEGKLSEMQPFFLETDIPGLHVFTLKSKDNTNALIWLILKDRETMINNVDLSKTKLAWTSAKNVKWINPWTGDEIANQSAEPGLDLELTNLETKITQVNHLRPLAGLKDKKGPHEQEDILLWITK